MNDAQWEDVGGNARTTDWDYAQLREDSGENPVLQGTYVEKRLNVGKNNSTIYVIETPAGELMSIWENALLSTRFDNVQIGDLVRIEYLGKATSEKTKRSYHNFKFQKARQAQPESAENTQSADEDFADLPF